MRTVAETEIFQCYAAAIWSEAEYAAFITWIAENSLSGDVIPETGDCRKVRWSRSGKGKRGGARVIYFNGEDGRIWLLIAYTKAKFGSLRLSFSPNSNMRWSMDKEMEQFQNDLLESVRQMKKASGARERSTGFAHCGGA
jgi:hypothetical protein